MIDIQIQDGIPKVELTDTLKLQVKEFSFNKEGYVEGLKFLGMPQEAIDSLTIQFKSSSEATEFDTYASVALFDSPTNKLSVGVGDAYDARYAQQERMWSYWPSELSASRSMTVNFALARSARAMVDSCLQAPEKIDFEKSKQELKDSTNVTGLASTVGALAGSQASQVIDLAPVFGGILGAGAGFSGAVVYAKARHTTVRKNHERLKHNLNDRQFDFANTQQARELFGNIVHVELLD